MSKGYPDLIGELEFAIMDARNSGPVSSALSSVLKSINDEVPAVTIRASLKAAFAVDPDHPMTRDWPARLEGALQRDVQPHIKRIDALIQDLKSDQKHTWPATLARMEESLQQFSQGLLPVYSVDSICSDHEKRGAASPRAGEICQRLDELTKFSRDPQLNSARADDRGRRRLDLFARRLEAFSEGVKNGAYSDPKIIEEIFDRYAESVTPFIQSADSVTKQFQDKMADFRTALREPSKTAQATVATLVEPKKPEPQKPERIINWNQDLLRNIPPQYHRNYAHLNREDLEIVLKREQRIAVKVQNYRAALDYVAECFEGNTELKKQFNKIQGRNLELPKEYDQRALVGLQLPRIQKEVIQFMRANDAQIRQFLRDAPQGNGKALGARIAYLKKYMDECVAVKPAGKRAADKSSDSPPKPMDPQLKQAIAGSKQSPSQQAQRTAAKTDKENLPPAQSDKNAVALKSEAQVAAQELKKAATSPASPQKDQREQNVKYFRKALDYLSESLSASPELQRQFDSIPGRHLVMPWQRNQWAKAELQLPKIRDRVMQFMNDHADEIKRQGSPELSKGLGERMQYLERYIEGCSAPNAAVKFPPAPLAPKLRQIMDEGLPAKLGQEQQRDQNLNQFKKTLDQVSQCFAANPELKMKFDNLPGRHFAIPWARDERGMAEQQLPKIRDRVMQFMKANGVEIKSSAALSDRVRDLNACVAKAQSKADGKPSNANVHESTQEFRSQLQAAKQASAPESTASPQKKT